MSASERILAAYGDLASVTPEVVAELVKFCAELGLDPGVIADLIYYESGWRPNAVNPKSGATGLIQFMPSTAAGLGAPEADHIVSDTSRTTGTPGTVSAFRGSV